MIDSRRLLGLIFSLLIALSSTVAAQWRLDGNEKLRNFHIDEHLNASASAQPSPEAIRELRSKLPRGASIYIVDLRQESHGFANQLPVSWHEEHNHANAGKTLAEIERDEQEQLGALIGTETTFVPLGKADTEEFSPKTIKVRTVQIEREVVEDADFNYVRIPAADMIAPDANVVEQFIDFVNKLPKDAWLHFHCQAGHGRTTTFLVMYEILKNPKTPLVEIVNRQVSLGGTDILALTDSDDWYAQRHRERAEMIRAFHQYIQSSRSSDWSNWYARTLELKNAPAFGTALAAIEQSNEDVTIRGKALATKTQMISLINRRNPKPKLNCSIEDIVEFYYAEAAREGIRADLALCQALKETGFFAYGGIVVPEQNNFCGLGVNGNNIRGESFATPQLGVRAHIQKLMKYKKWLELDESWAASPIVYYGEDILNLWRQALAPDGSMESFAESARRLKKNPNDAAAYINRAAAYFNSDQPERAVADFDTALRIEPRLEGFYDRALANTQLNNLEQAIADYTSVIEIDPMYPQAWYNRGRLNFLLGRFDSAIADFDAAIELEPHFQKQLQPLRDYATRAKEPVLVFKPIGG